MSAPLVVELTFNTDRCDVVLAFPAHFVVCHRCNGTGKHVNPSIDGNGISTEEFDQDPDFREAYFEGRYDVTCYECKGERVTPEISEERLTPKQKARLARYEKQLDSERAYDRECEMERRMGA